jgi:hypothetical protein
VRYLFYFMHHIFQIVRELFHIKRDLFHIVPHSFLNGRVLFQFTRAHLGLLARRHQRADQHARQFRRHLPQTRLQYHKMRCTPKIPRRTGITASRAI